VGDYETLVVADLPGLIEGAHEGKGLGQRFLRHIERTLVLLMLVEATDPKPRATLETLESELARWSKDLARRRRLLCFTKADLLDGTQRALLRDSYPGALVVSSHSGEGLKDLFRALKMEVRKAREEQGDLDTEAFEGPPAEDQLLRAGADSVPWPSRWVLPKRPGSLLDAARGEGQ